MKFPVLFIFCIFSYCSCVCMCQISRAKSASSYYVKYHVNQTDGQNVVPIQQTSYLTWVLSILGVVLVGLSGVLPVAVLPHLATNHNELVDGVLFKCLLSFAAGSLIGDVFIHLLPETYTKVVLDDFSNCIPIGLWSIFGLLTFMIIEKICPDDEDPITDNTSPVDATQTKKNVKKFFLSIKIIGILNMIANIVDNFTHGIAVAGSFQASHKFGLMTLIATLLHEIPHEIGDFVILLKSGLTYWQATMAQLMTASAGIIGAIFALAYTSAKDAGDVTSWILPFTSGGFLYIGLVGILPDIVKETDLFVSVKQLLSLTFGVLLIFLLALVFE